MRSWFAGLRDRSIKLDGEAADQELVIEEGKGVVARSGPMKRR